MGLILEAYAQTIYKSLWDRLLLYHPSTFVFHYIICTSIYMFVTVYLSLSYIFKSSYYYIDIILVELLGDTV